MSKLTKGLIGLVFLVLIVIAIGFGGKRYLENSVSEELQNWANTSPHDFKISFNEVNYSIKNNILLLSGVQFRSELPVNVSQQGRQTKGTLVIDIDSMEIVQPGNDFIALLRDPTLDLSTPDLILAERMTLKGIRVEAQNPVPGVAAVSLTEDESVITEAKIRTKMVRDILEKDSWQNALTALPYALSWKNIHDTGMVTEISCSTAFGRKLQSMTNRLEARSMTRSLYRYGLLQQANLNDISMQIDGRPLYRYDSMIIKDVMLPDQKVLARLLTVPSDISDEEAMDLFHDLLFSTGKPLAGSVVLSGLTVSSFDLPDIGIGKLSVFNTSLHPFNSEVVAEHILLPLSTDNRLQPLRLAGLKQLDLTACFNLKGVDANNNFKLSASLNAVDLGTVDMSVSGNVPLEPIGKILRNPTGMLTEKEMAAQINAYLGESCRIEKMEMGYADEGLLPRGLKMAKSLLGLSEESCLELAREYLAEMADGTNIMDFEHKMDIFLRNPGAVRLAFQPGTPVPIDELGTRTDFSIDLYVNPGPKTLQELANAIQ